jgi:hypothetical protein
MADVLNADEANSLQVRQTLRSRSRYECLEGNSFAKGIVHTLANDVIDSGPRLQMLAKNREHDSVIENSVHRFT